MPYKISLLQLHEAIGHEESQEFNEGIITEEVRRGFVLGDRLLRPATVKVSSGRKKASPNSEKSPLGSLQPQLEQMKDQHPVGNDRFSSL